MVVTFFLSLLIGLLDVLLIAARSRSADPYIQAPEELQNYNAYSYVLNRPLLLTDPSGEIVWQIPVFIIGAMLATHGNESWRMVGQIMMMAAMSTQGGLIEAGLGNAPEVAAVAANGGAAATGWVGAPSVFNAGAWANSALSAAVSSAVAGNSGEQTMLAALTAVGFSAAGSMAGAGGKLTGEQLGMHMLMGCVQSSMSGGQCGPGAISAGFAKVASTAMAGSDLHWTTHGMATMVVGGTASVMGGGKFANGALSAGMGYLFNQLASELEKSRHAAFGDARRAGGIPGSAVPLVTDEHLYDGNRSNPKFLYDKDGKPLMGRVYTYDVNGRTVVIQEHSVGHMQKGPDGKWVMQEKGHFNVRDANGNTLPGTRPHYEFKWRVDPMKYFWRRGGAAMPRGGDQ